MLVTSIQELLGIAPVQFEPLVYVMAGWFLLFLTAYFAEFLKLILLRWSRVR